MLKLSDFQKIIKERGKDYYNEGKVKNVINIDGVYYSKVNRYKVWIGGNTYGCTCPYYDYDNCKHMYALLLQLKSYGKNKPDDMISCLDNFSKETLAEIVKNLLKKHPTDVSIVKKYLHLTSSINTKNDKTK